MLTDLEVRKIAFTDKVTLYPDAEGLYLRVSKTRKRWQLSIRVSGKLRHFYAEKPYPELSLSEARKWANETRKLATSGVASKVSELSVAAFTERYRDLMVTNGMAGATLKKFDLRRSKYFSPIINKDIRAVTSKNIMDIIKPIAEKKHFDTMKQVHGYLHRSFLIAKAEGVIDSNPCEDLRLLLPTGKEKNRASVTEIHAFADLLLAVDSLKQATITKYALQIHALVFARPQDIRLGEWNEINWEQKRWEISGERMKMNEPLIIPLSRQTMQILRSLHAITGHQKYIFSMPNGKPYTDATLRKVLAEIGYFGAHQKDLPAGAKLHGPHGYRASARTIMDEVLRFTVSFIEHQLAHAVKDANGRAYNRVSYIEERTIMMQLWADFLDVLRTKDKEKINAFIEKNKRAV